MFFSKKKGTGLLSGIKAGGNLSLSISNVTIGGDQSVDIVGGKVFINGQHVADVDERKIEIHIAPQAVVKSVQSDVSINVHGAIHGNVEAGSVNCDTVNGNVTATQNVNCDSVRGDVKAGGNVNCGNVKGSVSAQRVNRS